VSLAIEVRRDRTSLQFLEALDAALISLGGRPNLIKDSRLPRWVFEETCPEADRFRHIRREWDRKRLFRSEMSERLGL
jgi:decaprenylphospho-beta-D-ribofuranose 2-oxidase